jgi:hypothetical protein
MIERDDPDPCERAELTEPELAIVTLVGRYVERSEPAQRPRGRPARRRRVRRYRRPSHAHRARLLRGDAR